MGLALTLLTNLCVAGSFVLLVLSLAVIIENRRYIRRRRDQSPPDPPNNPKVAVIVPCHGAEPNLREHCQQLLSQDYANFEVVFVVECESDPAVLILRNLMREHRFARINLVFSGPTVLASQKAHQLRVALENLPINTRIVAFADSDLLYGTSWLRWLVVRLREANIGAVTGGIWSVPKSQTVTSSFYCALHNGFASWFGRKFAPTLWGSWAARLDVLESACIDQVWSAAFSDSWSAHRALQLAGKRVLFESQSVGIKLFTAGANEVVSGFLRKCKAAFASRPQFCQLVVLANCIILAGTTIAAAKATYFSTQFPFAGFAWASLAVLLYGLGVANGVVRTQIGKTFTNQWRQYRRTRHFDCWGWPITLAGALALWTLSRMTRQVEWRGVIYNVSGGGCPTVVGRKRTEHRGTSFTGGRDMILPMNPMPPHGEVPSALGIQTVADDRVRKAA